MFGIDDAAFGAIASGVISGGAGLLGGAISSQGQSATNAQQMAFAVQQQQAAQTFNHDEAVLNRDWQKEMSSTAYQRAMADMRAAGLNPIMAAGNGGASTPGGASGSISPTSASLGNPGAGLGAGVASAGQAVQNAAATKVALTQAKKDQSTVDLNKATEDYTVSNTGLNKTLDAKAKQETATSAVQARVAEENARNIAADTANKGLQGIIHYHDGVTAAEKSRQAKAEADQMVNTGPGVWGNLANTVGRLGRGFVDKLKEEGHYDPGTGDVNKLSSSTFGGPRPGGLTIDIRK